MPYIGNTPAEKYAAFDVQYFTTSATASYTLDHAVANELDIRLVINNVIQEPGSGKAYTASGTTLTLSAATAGTDTMYCVYTGKASQTVNPPAGSVGINQLSATGTKDATTFLRGDNSFAVVSGTTINTNADNRVITGSGTANTLNGEANLTYDGSTLTVKPGSNVHQLKLEQNNATDYWSLHADSSGGPLSFQRYTGGAETEKMRIDTSGKVLIGTNTTTGTADGLNDLIVGNTSSGAHGISIQSPNNQTGYLAFADDSTSPNPCFISYDHAGGYQRFWVNGGERVRIKQYDFCFGTTSPISTNGVTFKVGTTAGDDWISSYRTTASTPHYIHAFYSDAGGTQTAKYAVYADGTASAISDVNYKKNITNARNYLEDLEKIDVIKYNLKTDNEDELKKLGFSAQQVETIFPNMIDTDNTPLKEFYEEGDEIPEGKAIGDIKKTTAREVKLLKKEIFVPMLVKAVQELSAKVKTLETENTDIKARLTALENA